MMPSAAPQQEAPHLGLLVDQLATLPAGFLPPAEVPELTAVEPARARSKEVGRQARSLKMLTTAFRSIRFIRFTRFAAAYGRALAAARNVLALVGLAALFGLVLPQQ